MGEPGKSEAEPFSVSALTDVIKGLFKPFDKVYVEGEISGWKVYPSGHAYFTLKDEGAQLACVMFASAIARCKAAPRLKDGAKVCLYGRLDVYAARGNYQLIVLAAKVAGEGDLMARYNELKERLEREGLFSASRKRRLPFLPPRRCNGASGAAAQFILYIAYILRLGDMMLGKASGPFTRSRVFRAPVSKIRMAAFSFIR